MTMTERPPAPATQAPLPTEFGVDPTKAFYAELAPDAAVGTSVETMPKHSGSLHTSESHFDGQHISVHVIATPEAAVPVSVGRHTTEATTSPSNTFTRPIGYAAPAPERGPRHAAPRQRLASRIGRLIASTPSRLRQSDERVYDRLASVGDKLGQSDARTYDRLVTTGEAVKSAGRATAVLGSVAVEAVVDIARNTAESKDWVKAKTRAGAARTKAHLKGSKEYAADYAYDKAFKTGEKIAPAVTYAKESKDYTVDYVQKRTNSTKARYYETTKKVQEVMTNRATRKHDRAVRKNDRLYAKAQKAEYVEAHRENKARTSAARADALRARA